MERQLVKVLDAVNNVTAYIPNSMVEELIGVEEPCVLVNVLLNPDLLLFERFFKELFRC